MSEEKEGVLSNTENKRTFGQEYNFLAKKNTQRKRAITRCEPCVIAQNPFDFKNAEAHSPELTTLLVSGFGLLLHHRLCFINYNYAFSIIPYSCELYPRGWFYTMEYRHRS